LRKPNLPPAAAPPPKSKKGSRGKPKGGAKTAKAKSSRAQTSPAHPTDRGNSDDAAKQQGKQDGQGDMTDFLDAIGYYSPTEEG
jgi:hypothetical protein